MDPLQLASSTPHSAGSVTGPIASESGSPLPTELRGAAFARCFEGFRASGDPLKDVTRLGYTCGPSTGMSPSSDPQEGAVAEGGAEVVVPLRLRERWCFRTFAAASSEVTEIEAEIVSSRGVVLARDHATGRVAVVQPDRPLCALAADDASVVVRSRGGAGRVAAWTWQVELPPSH